MSCVSLDGQDIRGSFGGHPATGPQMPFQQHNSVCRERSVGKLDRLKGRITTIPGQTDDRDVIQQAVERCDGVLTVLIPMNNEALFMVEALENDELIHKAPAIVGGKTTSALAAIAEDSFAR